MRGWVTTTIGLIMLGLIVILMLLVFVCGAGGPTAESVFCKPVEPVIKIFGSLGI